MTSKDQFNISTQRKVGQSDGTSWSILEASDLLLRPIVEIIVSFISKVCLQGILKPKTKKGYNRLCFYFFKRFD